MLNRKLAKFSSNNTESALEELKKSWNKFLFGNSNKKLIFLEGKILLKEAIKTNCVKIESVFFSNDDIFLNEIKSANQDAIFNKITQDLMREVSDLETSQGILGK